MVNNMLNSLISGPPLKFLDFVVVKMTKNKHGVILLSKCSAQFTIIIMFCPVLFYLSTSRLITFDSKTIYDQS